MKTLIIGDGDDTEVGDAQTQQRALVRQKLLQ